MDDGERGEEGRVSGVDVSRQDETRWYGDEEDCSGGCGGGRVQNAG